MRNFIRKYLFNAVSAIASGGVFFVSFGRLWSSGSLIDGAIAAKVAYDTYHYGAEIGRAYQNTPINEQPPMIIYRNAHPLTHVERLAIQDRSQQVGRVV